MNRSRLFAGGALPALWLAACSSPAEFSAVEQRPLAPAVVARADTAPRGCDVDDAPSMARSGDEAALARVLTWIWRDDAVEDYCGCTFGPDQQVHDEHCGGAIDPGQASIHWEPVVPPNRFGYWRDCWKNSAIEGDDTPALQNCRRRDTEFRGMEADLYNFHPALAGLSARRADNPFGLVQGEPRDFGTCDFELQSVMGKFATVEPPPDVRGDIARAYLYMAARYGKGKDWKLKLSREQRQLFESWSEGDPVDDRERLRACRIKALQGWENPYVK